MSTTSTTAASPENPLIPTSFRLGCTFIVIQCAAFLFLLSVYGRWLILVTPESLQSLWWVLGPFVLLTDFLNPAFLSPLWFFMLYGVVLLLLTIVLVRNTIGFKTRVVTITNLFLVLLAPLALLRLYEPYQLAAKAKPGYTMQWLTEPENQFASAFKSAQRLYEKEGCQYTLYGWSTANELFYGSNCDGNFWQYNPQTQRKPVRAAEIPNAVVAQSTVTRWTSNVGPSSPGGFQEFVITQEKSTSPNGRMEAAIIQNTFYGPYDIVILIQEE